MDNRDKQIIAENILNGVANLWSTLLDPLSDRVCTLDCCVGNNRFLEGLLELSEQVVEIIGITGLERIRRFDEDMMDLAIECDGNEESPEWLDIQDFVRITIDHIKQAVAAHQSGSIKPKKYPLEYIDHFMKTEIRNIACAERFGHGSFDPFIPRCRFILDNPDEYTGITYKIFKELELLYALVFTFKVKLPIYDPKIESSLAQTDHFKEIKQSAQKILNLFEERTSL